MLQSIRSRLTVSHFAALLILAVLMQGLWYLQMRKFLHQHEQEELAINSQQVSRLVSETLDGYRRTLSQIGQGRPVLDYHQTYRDLALADYLNDFSNTFPLICYLDADGAEELRVVNGKLVEGNNHFAERPWFKRARQQPGKPKTTILPATAGAPAQVLMALGIHQYFSNRFDAALLVRFDLDKLLPGVEHYVAETGRSVILFNPAGEVLFQKLPAGQTKLRQAGLTYLPPGVRSATGAVQTAGKTELFGHKGFFRSSQLPGLDLNLLLYSPLSEYESRLNSLLRSSSLMVPLLFLVVALYIGAAARKFAKPLRIMAEAADQVARGRLDQQIEATAPGEIGELLQAFDQMVRQLKETTISKTFMNSIIDSMHEVLLVANDRGDIQRANRAAEQLFGRGQDQLQSMSLADLFPDQVPPVTLFGQVEGVREMEVTTADGQSKVLLLSSSSLPEGGEVLVAQDISSMKQAERDLQAFASSLEQSNRELQEFAYVASHDLQEPLRKIIAFGDRLTSKFGSELGETGLDYLDRMQNASARMQTLINDLLAFSRVTTKGRPFELLELNAVVSEVLSDLEIRVTELGASIEVGPLPTLYGDPLQIRQLFQNLLANALKFHRDGVAPLIHISAEPLRVENRELYRLSIRDNGIGFDEKYLDKIFGVFQRLHGRSSYEGSGIGLAICQKIVRRHGGRITARSVPDQGAQFIIELPVAQKDEQAA